MRRLYEISYNEDKYVIKGSREEKKYTIVDKKTFDSYNILGDIIGMEQISDDTFLVYRRTQRYMWQITRIKLKTNYMQTEFSKEFERFEFLTDDTILFDNNSVYSISANTLVNEFDMYRFNSISVYDALNGKKAIYVEAKIVSTQLPNLYVMVLVDGETLKPVSQAFSSLRNQLITLSDEYTFKDLQIEDKMYADIIGDFLYEEDKKVLNIGQSTIFSQYPIKY